MLTIVVADATFADLYDRLIESCPAVERMDREREHVFYSAEHGPSLIFGALMLSRAQRPAPTEWR